MVSALWDLKALQQDASFVESNPEMFALGTKSKKRKARAKAIKKEKSSWKSEFDSLRTQAIKCVDDFGSSCEKLAKKYESREPLTERAKLPIRYSSDCSQTIQLKDLAAKVNVYTMVQSPTKGDAEMKSGPVRVKTKMKIYEDGSQLKLLHQTVTQEWKTDKKAASNQ